MVEQLRAQVIVLSPEMYMSERHRIARTVWLAEEHWQEQVRAPATRAWQVLSNVVVDEAQQLRQWGESIRPTLLALGDALATTLAADARRRRAAASRVVAAARRAHRA